MKTSDLIGRLQERLKLHGDLPVCIVVKGAKDQIFAMPNQTAHARMPQLGKIAEVNVILSEFILPAETIYER